VEKKREEGKFKKKKLFENVDEFFRTFLLVGTSAPGLSSTEKGERLSSKNNRGGMYFSGRALAWHTHGPGFGLQHCKNKQIKVSLMQMNKPIFVFQGLTI
jgi:hypothetical protein